MSWGRRGVFEGGLSYITQKYCTKTKHYIHLNGTGVQSLYYKSLPRRDIKHANIQTPNPNKQNNPSTNPS